MFDHQPRMIFFLFVKKLQKFRGLRNGLIFIVLFLTACNANRQVSQETQKQLLVKNKIEFKAPKKLKFSERDGLVTELNPLMRQKPNRTRLFKLMRPGVWYYYHYKNRNSKYARWVMKEFAEPPAFYNEDLTQRTARNFENQVRQRGYLNAKCTWQPKFFAANRRAKRDSLINRASVTYLIDLGTLYTIDTVIFASRDSAAMIVMDFTSDDSRIKAGDGLDGRLFESEKLRLTNEMKNRGYAYFAPNFVEFTGDSTKNKTKVRVEILPPGNDTARHKTYTIGTITVLSELAPSLEALKSDTIIGGVYFASSEPEFEVRARHLFKAIAIRPGWPYRQVDFDKTARNLNEMGVFSFVNIRPLQDPLHPDKLNVEISLAPNKRFSYLMDFDVNSSNSSSALAGRLFGLAGSVSLQNRNLFGGAEHLQSNVQYNIEFDITQRSFIFSQQFKFQNELIFPRFFDYLHIWRGLNRTRIGKKDIISDAFYNDLRANGKARISANYNYLELFNFYLYNLVNVSIGTDLRRNNRHQFAFDYMGIDLLRPRTYSRFDTIFGQNKFLTNSFGNQLFTGFLLRSVNYSFSRPVNRFGETLTLRSNIELSGLEEYLVNQLWSVPFKKEVWAIDGAEFSKFVRLDLDGIYSRVFNEKGTLGAIRVGAGVALPYGNTKATPYVKQFFVGGPSSLRAWRIRELGPGGYRIAPEADTIRPFYQSGDFRFEFNGELRFPLFWWVKGAVFIDGGNIWSLDPNDDRKDSQLRLSSLRNLAIGTGVGIRADFSYFVLRLDWGLKLRRPYRNEGDQSYWVPNLITNMQPRDWAINLAVGYPF